jgi:hypothetical protein
MLPDVARKRRSAANVDVSVWTMAMYLVGDAPRVNACKTMGETIDNSM